MTHIHTHPRTQSRLSRDLTAWACVCVGSVQETNEWHCMNTQCAGETICHRVNTSSTSDSDPHLHPHTRTLEPVQYGYIKAVCFYAILSLAVCLWSVKTFDWLSQFFFYLSCVSHWCQSSILIRDWKKCHKRRNEQKLKNIYIFSN